MTLPPTSQNRRPVTESSERFLRAIVSDVTIERLDELHLFTALRQGVYETGVAVIAVSPADNAHADRSQTTRHIVYTARYRLVVKGPDRGRWEFECVAEADAPLITVEMVVRGVQRRSGDLDDPVRYDTASLAHVLRLELPDADDAAPAEQETLVANESDVDESNVDLPDANASSVDESHADSQSDEPSVGEAGVDAPTADESDADTLIANAPQ